MADEHRRAPDAVLVGAGLAGPACALDLCRAGRRVTLPEASDGVGGRMRADRRDGFLPDRAFQVFNTSYPRVKRRLDPKSPRLRPFTAGIIAHTPDGPVRLADPTREPGAAGASLPGRVSSARDLAALTTWDAVLPASAARRRRDGSASAALTRAGASDAVIADILRPFLSGVFPEDRLGAPARSCHLVRRSMVRGPLCLPAQGIGAVPAQLADGLPAGVLRLDTPVTEVTDAGVLLRDGSEVPARTVVVATDPATAVRRLPDLTVPDTRAATTYHHATDSTPMAEPTLMVDSTRAILNTCVLSAVAPTYAPPGTGLISTSVPGTDLPGGAQSVLPRLAGLYGADTNAWQRVAACTVEGALPVMLLPRPLSRTPRLGPGRHVRGDHRATGSVPGAPASDARAARGASADLERQGPRRGASRDRRVRGEPRSACPVHLSHGAVHRPGRGPRNCPDPAAARRTFRRPRVQPQRLAGAPGPADGGMPRARHPRRRVHRRPCPVPPPPAQRHRLRHRPRLRGPAEPGRPHLGARHPVAGRRTGIVHTFLARNGGSTTTRENAQ